MIVKTLEKLEKNLAENTQLNTAQKDEFRHLLSQLKNEIHTIAATHGEDAKNIVDHAEGSLNEVIKADSDKNVVDNKINGLTNAIEGFEASHPKLVEAVNAICTRLSNMGI
jgi:uncharacterized phage infection (PIP) family protein YhgE